jgi:hypothetical protein
MRSPDKLGIVAFVVVAAIIVFLASLWPGGVW